MSDMLVNLYHLKPEYDLIESLENQGITIKRAVPGERSEVLSFISHHFTLKEVDECRAAFSNQPVTCYLAMRGKEIIGYACYEAKAKNFFGPTGVVQEERYHGVGKALLYKSLISMQEMGYIYGIIGWSEAGDLAFYKKTIGAIMIDDDLSGIFGRLIENSYKEE